MSVTRRSRLHAGAAFASLLAVVVAAFLPSLGGWFLSDDFEANLLLRDGRLDLGRLAREFVSPWLGFEGHQAYRPLVSLHYAFDWTFFGGTAFGYHLGNLLAHALAALLVLVSIRLLFPSKGWIVAFAAASLFALHPARAEAVSWIAGRVSSTAGALAIGSFALGVAAFRRGSRAMRFASAGLFVLALLAKEESVAVPAALVGARLVAEGPTPFRARLRPALVEALPHLAILVAYLAWRRVVLGSVASPGGETGTIAGAFFATLPGKARALFYPARPDLPFGLRVLAAVHLLVPAGAAFLLLRRETRAAVVVLALWLAASLAPTFPVAVHPHFGGARTLTLAALPVSVAAALVLPAPSRRGSFAPATAFLFLEALLVVAPLRLLLDEQARWKAGWSEAIAFVRAVDATAGERPAAPIALLHFPTGADGIPGFDTNSVECALQRPHLRRDLPVLNGIQCLLDRERLDAAALDAAGEVASARVAWSPAIRALVDYPPRPRRDLEHPEASAGIRLGPHGGRIEWDLDRHDPRQSASLEVLLDAEGPVRVAARWIGASDPTPAFDRAELEEVGLANGARRFYLSIGSHLGWFVRGLTEGGISRIEIDFEGEAIEVRRVRLRGRLDPLEVPLLDGERLEAHAWRVPFVAAEPGAHRLVWMTPGETGSFEFDASEARDGRIAFDANARRSFELLLRLSNDPVVYYFFETLGRRGAVHSATARSRVGRFRLGEPGAGESGGVAFTR